MGLRSWLGLRKPRQTKPFRSDLIDLYDADDPLTRLYADSISAAQDGRRDNLGKRMRYTALAQIAARAADEHPDPDFIECGCLFGHSTHLLAEILQKRAHKSKLHVFDSFEGLSAFEDVDYSEFTPSQASSLKRQKHFSASYETVADGLRKYPFVQLYKGWIPDRFSEVADRNFSFASIDVDLYRPTLDSLEFIFPRLVEGGSIYFDDYGYKDFPGARKAVDEYLATQTFDLFLRLSSGGAILIK